MIADFAFTTPTIIIQSLTGAYLIHLVGFPFTSTWIVASAALYLLAGACWLPVVWMQIKMRDMAQGALVPGTPLPPRYWSFLKWWVSLGIVCFRSTGRAVLFDGREASMTAPHACATRA